MKLFSKRNCLISFSMFLYIIFVEFINIFIVGPIGILGNNRLVIKIINVIGKFLFMVPLDVEYLNEILSDRFLSCNNPCGQLVRLYMDSLGFTLLIFVPMLAGKYIYVHIKTIENAWQMIFLNLKIAGYIILNIFIISVIPFISLCRLASLTGSSAMQLFKYLGVWILPSVILIINILILLALLIKEREAQYFFYALVAVPSLTPDGTTYPFYKIIIRFNGKNEAFYIDAYRDILINRIIIIGVAIVLFIVACLCVKRRKALQIT